MEAMTIWVDESTEIKLDGKEYNMIGYIITDSDESEFNFLNKLKQSRKEEPVCWTTIHGCEINEKDKRKLALLHRWLKIFKDDTSVCFHVFLYKKNTAYISRHKTYEHYFAKQSVFSLAYKMQKNGKELINRMFKDVGTLTVFFDRRRSHIADIVSKDSKSSIINRINELEDVYQEEINAQIKKIAEKDNSSLDFTTRFSFVSSACFDVMQLSDCLLYLTRKKLEESVSGPNVFTEIFDEYFLNNLNKHTRDLGFKKIYEFDKKFNFFESYR